VGVTLMVSEAGAPDPRGRSTCTLSSSIGRATGLIPRWFAYAGYVVGLVLLLSYTVAAWFALLFAAWVLVLCIVGLLRRSQRDRIPQGEITLGDDEHGDWQILPRRPKGARISINRGLVLADIVRTVARVAAAKSQERRSEAQNA